MPATIGVLTTQKVDSLLHSELLPGVRTRRDLADALRRNGSEITDAGVEAWFRHVDGNYRDVERRSLSTQARSYRIPPRRILHMLGLFGLSVPDLNCTDSEFRANCYEARERRSKASLQSRIADSHPPKDLVGRAAEYETLHRAFQLANTTEPQVVVLEGDAGVGKSKLLEVFMAALDDVDCVVLSATAVESAAAPLMPIVNLLQKEGDRLIAIDARAKAPLDRLRAQYSEATLNEDSATGLYVFVSEILLSIARMQSLVLVIDDAHWADESSLGFLDHFCVNHLARAGCRILLVLSARVASAETLRSAALARITARNFATHIQLQPLSERDTATLLEEAAGASLSTEVLKIISSVALGNPLFSREMLFGMRRDGMLHARNGVLHASNTPGAAHTPDGVGEIYLRTFLTLTVAVREVLSFASALGLSIDVAQLELLMEGKRFSEIIDALEQAEKAGLVAYRRGGFEFRHPTIRHRIYESLSDVGRMRTHLAIAQQLQNSATQKNAYEDIQIAHHLIEAGSLALPALVAPYCARAAVLSRNISAWDQALNFARKAMALAPESTDLKIGLGELAEIVGSALHQVGRAEEALTALEDAAVRFAAIDARQLYAQARHQAARIRGNFGLVPPSDVSDLDELQRLALEVENYDRRLAARIYDTLSSRYMYAQRSELALEFGQRAFQVLEGERNCVERPLGLVQSALAALRLLRLQSAHHWLADARDAAIVLGDAQTHARVLQQSSSVSFVMGKFDELQRQLDGLAVVGETIASTGELTGATAVRLALAGLRRSPATDVVAFETALESIRDTGYAWSLPKLVGAHAHALCLRGDFAGAALMVTDVRADRTLPGIARYQGQLSRLMSLIAARQRVSDNRTDGGRNGSSLSSNATFASFDAREYDVDKVLRYAIDLEVSLATDDERTARVAIQALLFAFRRGCVFTDGWPICLPALIAQGLIATHQPEAAMHFRSLAIDTLARLELWGALEEFVEKFGGVLGESDYALLEARHLLQRR